MSKKLTNLLLAFILLTFVFSPLTVLANDSQEGAVQSQCSHASQAISKMSSDLSGTWNAYYDGPLGIFRPIDLAFDILNGVFIGIPAGVYKDIKCHLSKKTT